jgi:hypothetical protein
MCLKIAQPIETGCLHLTSKYRMFLLPPQGSCIAQKVYIRRDISWQLRCSGSDKSKVLLLILNLGLKWYWYNTVHSYTTSSTPLSEKLRLQHGEQCRIFPQFHPKTVRFIDEIVVSWTEHHVMNSYGAGSLAPRVVWPQHEMDVSVQILVPALPPDNEPLVPFRQVAAKLVPQSVRHFSKEQNPVWAER